MRTSLRWTVVLVLLSTGWAFAEQPAPPKAPAKAKPAAQADSKTAAFEKIFTEWKALLTELRELREEYGSATPERQKEIAARYDELVAKGTVMQDEVSKAAEEAYAKNPGKDKDVELFLVASCHGNFKMDNYEEALRLADLLIQHQCQQKDVYVWGGISAYCVGELDKAEKYLNKAAEEGAELRSGKDALDALVMRFLQDPDTVKADWKKEQAIRAAEAKADDLPRVLLKTTKGDIEIELFENEAPNATANFISLVEKGFYNGLSFHRVLDGFMAQGGDPTGNGTGGPGYSIACECYQPNFRKHFRGSLSMAHAGRDTGGSQFFLTFIPTTFLDGKHTVFGRVIKGMDILAKIRRRDPSDTKAALPPPDKIIEATVIRKRPHEYVPKKVAK